MPFNEKLADQIRKSLKGTRGLKEKKMFGGLCFLVHGNMCCGVERDHLVVRVGPENYERLLKRKFARPMDFTGRPLKGLVYVSKGGYDTAAKLKSWIGAGLDFVKTLPKK